MASASSSVSPKRAATDPADGDPYSRWLAHPPGESHQTVLAGAGKPHLGPPPKNIQALDQHYENLQRELRRTFDTLLITVAPGSNTNTNMFASTPA
ncbi:MAG: hypothetical protein IPJ27_08080 [Candidatus Accumulibacter sp.]|uniref:Uncharacterized protein n=1 Tax=Candidatus Accumulibacter proximus TaxID=2954385 RepID=A0A935PWM9_9PROT|nr:hypothetical protein [Candidatus Accumulibacter proximus]